MTTRALGIPAGAPVFIPFMGAVIAMKGRPKAPIADLTNTTEAGLLPAGLWALGQGAWGWMQKRWRALSPGAEA